MRNYNNHSGQVSIEFLLVVVLASLLLTPIFVILSSQSANIEETNRNIQVSSTINTIVEAGKIINAQGPPSKMLISVKFPSNVDSVIIDNQEIIFYVTQGGIINSIAEGVDFNVSGNLTNDEGLHKIVIKAVSSGSNSWVNISEYEG